MSTTMDDAQWQVVPATPEQIAAAAQQSRRMVSRRALLAAGVAMVPLPGMDWLVDVGILVKLLPDINRTFGLTPEQVERLAPDRKLVVLKAVSAGSALLVGRVFTRELVMKLLRLVGVRLTTQQAVKFVPIAGQEKLVGALQKHGRDVLGEGLRTHGVPIYTDARLYTSAGVPAVLYGAGPRTLVEANGHRADERLVLADLHKATEVVARALADLLGAG